MMNTHFPRFRTRIVHFIGDQAFYKVALLVMLPVVLQQLTSAAFSFIDSSMLIRIGELSMSAVSVACKMTVLYNSLFFGFAGAASVLLSQYHGAERPDVCQRVFSLLLLIALLFSLAFATVILLLPAQIMQIFVHDPVTVSVGVSYLRIIAWSYLPTAFSVTCLFSLRALGINFLPMLVSLLAIVVNILLEWVLVFGRLGVPSLGVRGAALGILLSRLLEMITYAIVLLMHKTPFRLSLVPAFRVSKPLFRDYLHRAFPFTANELMWTSGFLVYFWAYARIDESAISALNVSDQVLNLALVLTMGFGSASAVLVGKPLGANQFVRAKENAKRLCGLAIMLSTVSVAIALGLSSAVGQFFPTLSPEHIALTQRLIYLGVCFFHCNAIYSLCFLLLRSGGDAKNAVMLDSGFLWILPVPLALLIGLFMPGKMSILATACIIQLPCILRVILALRVVKRGTWLKNLTRDHA